MEMVRIIGLTIVVATTNIIWYLIKFTVKENGYPMSLFSGHLKDIGNILKLAKSTENPELKKKCNILVYSLAGCLVLFVLMFIGTF